MSHAAKLAEATVATTKTKAEALATGAAVGRAAVAAVRWVRR